MQARFSCWTQADFLLCLLSPYHTWHSQIAGGTVIQLLTGTADCFQWVNEAMQLVTHKSTISSGDWIEEVHFKHSIWSTFDLLIPSKEVIFMALEKLGPKMGELWLQVCPKSASQFIPIPCGEFPRMYPRKHRLQVYIFQHGFAIMWSRGHHRKPHWDIFRCPSRLPEHKNLVCGSSLVKELDYSL